MSKNKPKETIEYVFRLQDKERQLFEDLTTAYTVRNVGQGVGSIASPIVSLLSNPEALIISIPIIYAFFYPRKDMTIDDTMLYKAISGGPGQLFENLSMWYVVKRKEYLAEATPEEIERLQTLELLWAEQLPVIGPLFRLFH